MQISLYDCDGEGIVGDACYVHVLNKVYGKAKIKSFQSIFLNSSDFGPKQLKVWEDCLQAIIPDWVWEGLKVETTLPEKLKYKGLAGEGYRVQVNSSFYKLVDFDTKKIGPWSAFAVCTIFRYIHEFPQNVEKLYKLKTTYPKAPWDLLFAACHKDGNSNHIFLIKDCLPSEKKELKTWSIKDVWIDQKEDSTMHEIGGRRKKDLWEVLREGVSRANGRGGEMNHPLLMEVIKSYD